MAGAVPGVRFRSLEAVYRDTGRAVCAGGRGRGCEVGEVVGGADDEAGRGGLCRGGRLSVEGGGGGALWEVL